MDINSDRTSEPNPTPPRFDSRSKAKAKPVQPLERNRFSFVTDWFASLRGQMTGQSRMVIAVIVVGLVTGALAGFLLVNMTGSKAQPMAAEPFSSQVSEVPPAEQQSLDAFANELNSEVRGAAMVGQFNNRPRRIRRVNTARPRAYRVAVIR